MDQVSERVGSWDVDIHAVYPLHPRAIRLPVAHRTAATSTYSLLEAVILACLAPSVCRNRGGFVPQAPAVHEVKNVRIDLRIELAREMLGRAAQ